MKSPARTFLRGGAVDERLHRAPERIRRLGAGVGLLGLATAAVFGLLVSPTTAFLGASVAVTLPADTGHPLRPTLAHIASLSLVGVLPMPFGTVANNSVQIIFCPVGQIKTPEVVGGILPTSELRFGLPRHKF